MSLKLKLDKDKGTIYELLNHVSEKSGYQFIYDSQIINNDKKIKIKKGEYSLREAIYTITGSNQWKINIIGKHILLRNGENPYVAARTSIATPDNKQDNHIVISGTIYDRMSNEPIIYGTVSINQSSIGTVSNRNGEFKFIIPPDSLNESSVRFSHVGYQTEEIKASFLAGQNIKLSLEPKIVPLQEVVVRIVNPQEEVNKMLEKRLQNYPSTPPTLLTTFYREGVDHKKNNTDISEAVLQIYKTGYQHSSESDQVKLIKMRRIVSQIEKDSIVPKMKSGIQSSLFLDIMKKTPDFLDINRAEEYNYTHTDISYIDNKRVNVISFEQKDHIKTPPLYKGELYIDPENSALVEARFEVNPPQYARLASRSFIEKKDPKLDIILKEAKYIVTYRKLDNGLYNVNHIRADIKFNIKRKRRLFSSGSALHIWFEMVNCKTETENVKGIRRKDRLPVHKIFSETKYKYDKNFWGGILIS